MRNLAPDPRAIAMAAIATRQNFVVTHNPLREQDRLLPMANIGRLMAAELPQNSKISRDSKVLMQELVTEFICFVTSDANDVSLANFRKALTPEDIVASFEALGKTGLALHCVASACNPFGSIRPADNTLCERPQIWMSMCLSLMRP